MGGSREDGDAGEKGKMNLWIRKKGRGRRQHLKKERRKLFPDPAADDPSSTAKTEVSIKRG